MIDIYFNLLTLSPLSIFQCLMSFSAAFQPIPT